MLAAVIAACFAFPEAQANPVGPQIVHGQVGFSRQGATLNITNSPGAIINWQGFSIGAGETTRFIQQNAASSVLNRVVTAAPSELLGNLYSNGRVFLINPAGILVGQGARIDVAGFVASTLNLSNADFLAGRMNFQALPGAGGILNQGQISASGGQVYLVAPQVENQGVISAVNGEIILAAGKSVQIADTSTPGVRVEVSASDEKVENIGSLIAQSGTVGLVGAVVRNKGRINADQVARGADGRIYLRARKDVTLEAGSTVTANGARGGTVTVASETGTTGVSGTIEARGDLLAMDGAGSDLGKGGSVHLLGTQVGVFGDTTVNVSGAAGGGDILIGGDVQGRNPEFTNALRTYIGKDAVLRADATDRGDGGKVIVWSDQVTRFHGSILARGGANGGNGGFVETSGKQSLYVTGSVDTRSPQGSAGNWLLDPTDITIISGAGAFTSLGEVDAFADANNGANTIDVALINGSGTQVTLQATNDVSLATDVNMTTAGIGISMEAGNNIELGDYNISTNGGNIALTANSAASGGASGSGSITRVGGGNLSTYRSIAGNGGAVTLSTSGTGSIDVGSVNTYGYTQGGDSGNVSMSTANGSISAANISTYGAGHTGGGAGKGGNVTLSAGGSGAITVGNIVASGGSTTTNGMGGAGGNISLTTHDASLTAGNLTSIGGSGGASAAGPGFGGGHGGVIALSISNPTSERMLSVGTIEAYGGHGGNAGPSDNPGGPGGSGGQVTISSGAALTLADLSINVKGGNGGNGMGTGTGGAGGNGGAIIVTSGAGNLDLSTDLFNGLTASGGNGGTGSATGAVGGVGGNGGTVLLYANSGQSDISLEGYGIVTSGGSGGGGSGFGGDGGSGGVTTLGSNAGSNGLLLGQSTFYQFAGAFGVGSEGNGMDGAPGRLELRAGSGGVNQSGSFGLDQNVKLDVSGNVVLDGSNSIVRLWGSVGGDLSLTSSSSLLKVGGPSGEQLSVAGNARLTADGMDILAHLTAQKLQLRPISASNIEFSGDADDSNYLRFSTADMGNLVANHLVIGDDSLSGTINFKQNTALNSFATVNLVADKTTGHIMGFDGAFNHGFLAQNLFMQANSVDLHDVQLLGKLAADIGAGGLAFRTQGSSIALGAGVATHIGTASGIWATGANVKLESSAGITQESTASLTAQTAELRAYGGSVSLNDPGNNVGTLAGFVNASTASFGYSSDNAITIGSVGTTYGIRVFDGDIGVNSNGPVGSSITIQSTGTAEPADVYASGSYPHGNVALTAKNIGLIGTVRGDTAVALRPADANGNVHIVNVGVDGEFSLNPVVFQNITAPRLEIGRNDGSGTLNLSVGVDNSHLATIGSQFNLLSGGDISLAAGVTFPGEIGLQAGGMITQSAGTLSATMLKTSSVGGTNLNQANAVASFNASNSGSGNIGLANSVELNITGLSHTGGGDVNVLNVGSVTVSGPVSFSGNATLYADAFLTTDLTVNASITGTGVVGKTLKLRADDNVIIGSGVSISGSGLNIEINSNRDGVGEGAIQLQSGSTIASGGGSITLGGGADPMNTAALGTSTFVNGIKLHDAQLNSGGGTISLRGSAGIGVASEERSGVYLSESSISSGNGSITIHGQGGTGGIKTHGVEVVQSTVTTTGGNIVINGTGGTGGGNNHLGIEIEGPSTAISSAGGAIAISGTGGGDGASYANDGIQMFDGARIETTGPGSITVTGLGGGGQGGQGLSMFESSLLRTTGSGAVVLQGTATGTGWHWGVDMSGGAVVESTAASGGGAIQITGTGSATGSTNSAGIALSNWNSGGPRISSASGPISLSGQGGGGSNAYGVYFNRDAGATSGATALIESTDVASIAITGTGGGAAGISIDQGSLIGNAVQGNTTGAVSLTSLSGTGISLGGEVSTSAHATLSSAAGIAFSGSGSIAAGSASLTAASTITSGTAATDIDTSVANGTISLTSTSAIGTLAEPLRINLGTGQVNASTTATFSTGDINLASDATIRLGAIVNNSTAILGNENAQVQNVRVTANGASSDIIITQPLATYDNFAFTAGRDIDIASVGGAGGYAIQVGQTLSFTAGRNILSSGSASWDIYSNVSVFGDGRPATTSVSLNAAGLGASGNPVSYKGYNLQPTLQTTGVGAAGDVWWVPTEDGGGRLGMPSIITDAGSAQTINFVNNGATLGGFFTTGNLNYGNDNLVIDTGTTTSAFDHTVTAASISVTGYNMGGAGVLDTSAANGAITFNNTRLDTNGAVGGNTGAPLRVNPGTGTVAVNLSSTGSVYLQQTTGDLYTSQYLISGSHGGIGGDDGTR